jgi:acylphosphatase
MKKRYRVLISGRVQGVYFRANTSRMATTLGLTGWVRNLPDRRVEVVFEGSAAAADEMLRWCGIGTPPARVDRFDQYEETPTGEFTGFEILY